MTSLWFIPTSSSKTHICCSERGQCGHNSVRTHTDQHKCVAVASESKRRGNATVAPGWSEDERKQRHTLKQVLCKCNIHFKFLFLFFILIHRKPGITLPFPNSRNNRKKNLLLTQDVDTINSRDDTEWKHNRNNNCSDQVLKPGGSNSINIAWQTICNHDISITVTVSSISSSL